MDSLRVQASAGPVPDPWQTRKQRVRRCSLYGKITVPHEKTPRTARGASEGAGGPPEPLERDTVGTGTHSGPLMWRRCYGTTTTTPNMWMASYPAGNGAVLCLKWDVWT
jgi:hypothetical protein